MRARRRPPVAPESTAERRAAVDERRQRALEEPLSVRPKSTQPYLLLEVRNPIHRTGYLVMMPTFPATDVAMCTCTDFARRGLGTCKHIEATARWLREHPDLPPVGRRLPSRSGLWRSIDRAIAARASDPTPESQSWRRPGRTLFASVGTT